MSASFLCWEPHLGLNPGSQDFRERAYAIQRAHKPPSPTMLAFIEFLLAKYPDLHPTQDTIWAAIPLNNEISGAFIHVAVRWKFYTEARLFIRPAAHQFGLDYHDPQENLYIPAEKRE